jgi:membrane protease YdiL (CAAX protease family)
MLPTPAPDAPTEPRPSPFSGSDVAIVLGCALLLPLLVAPAVTELSATTVFGLLLPAQWLGNGIGLFIVARRRRATEADFGLPILPRDFGGVGVGMLAFIAVLSLLGPLVESLDLEDTSQVAAAAFGEIDSPLLLAAAIISICVLAPLMEEMTYRGVLHGALRNRLGGIATVLVGSAIFSVAHLSGLETEVDRFWVVAGISMLQIFLFALVLGWLRERDRRIGRAFFAHGAWNAINLIAILSLPYLEG